MSGIWDIRVRLIHRVKMFRTVAAFQQDTGTTDLMRRPGGKVSAQPREQDLTCASGNSAAYTPIGLLRESYFL